MTELQTILKDTLARWEAETQQRLQEQQREIAALRAELRQVQSQQAQQGVQAAQWQRLNALCAQLEPLLSRLNAVLPRK